MPVLRGFLNKGQFRLSQPCSHGGSYRKQKRGPDLARQPRFVVFQKTGGRAYFVVEVVSVVEDVLFFVFLCFAFLVVVSVLAVFCANTTEPDKRESPRAAIMIFFITNISLRIH
jgi:hypothetical protein